MTEPGNHDPLRDALREVLFALGGVVDTHHLDDELVRAIASAIGAVIDRHLGRSAGTSGSMSHATRLRPHPAILELLKRIDAASNASAARARSDREWLRLPGLFRRWELEQVIDAGDEHLVEDAGHDESGGSLFAIYARSYVTEENAR